MKPASNTVAGGPSVVASSIATLAEEAELCSEVVVVEAEVVESAHAVEIAKAVAKLLEPTNNTPKAPGRLRAWRTAWPKW
ncbi:hypothetical protein ACUHMQ_14760 [Chitinimonas sp. PSY-7]|uniref:hypothetical protein n=1 Tax=Chitinimonas sp. PSY-7 TaxID=3459088 RepID=UPI0040401F68